MSLRSSGQQPPVMSKVTDSSRESHTSRRRINLRVTPLCHVADMVVCDSSNVHSLTRGRLGLSAVLHVEEESVLTQEHA